MTCQFRMSDFLPEFIVSIKALRLDIVNCKETTTHEQVIYHHIFSQYRPHNNSQITHTLYFIEIVVFLLGKQVWVSVFSGVNLSDKQRFEPAVFTESYKTPVVKPNTKISAASSPKWSNMREQNVHISNMVLLALWPAHQLFRHHRSSDGIYLLLHLLLWWIVSLLCRTNYLLIWL